MKRRWVFAPGRVISWLMTPGIPAAVTSAAILLAIVLPLAIVMVFSFFETHRTMTSEALERRTTVARLASTMMNERFDRLFDVGTALATRVQFRRSIAEDDWQRAIDILERAPDDFPFVERIFLADPEGTLRADVPHREGVVGVNFAFRDWYQGVSRDWEPYLSKVYQRTAEPRYNLVAVTVPIKTDDGEVLGIMVMQVLLDTFVAWSKGFDVGPEGHVYFVDHEGTVAGHPDVPTERIANIGHLEVTRRVLQGGAGVLTYMPDGGADLIAAYAPLGAYGWGAIVEQPVSAVFAERDRTLTGLAVMYGGIFLANLLLGLIVVRMLWSVANAYRREEGLLAHIGDGVVVIDRDFTIRRINKVAASLSGWTEKELIGSPFRDRFRFLREHDRKENVTFIEEAMLYGEVRAMEDHTIMVTHDGREVPVGDSAAPIFDAKGNVRGAVIIFRDLTKEREMRNMRSDFAYASHQLRTPVNKAMWALNIAAESKRKAEMRAQIDEATASMESMVKMVNSLLDVARLDQGEVKPHFQEVSVPRIVKKVHDEIKDLVKQKDITLNVSAPSEGVAAVTDSKLLGSVLREVIENAVTYGRREGSVEIVIDDHDHEIVMHVRDDGIGIPKEDQPLIFTKFFRGSNFDTSDIPGGGLSLYMTRQYLRLLNGRIWFESEEGKGTTFHIAVPKR